MLYEGRVIGIGAVPDGWMESFRADIQSSTIRGERSRERRPVPGENETA